MHNIEYFTYKENIDKKAVENEINDYIEENGEYGGDNIRWCNNKICSDIEEAKRFIHDNDRGSYDHLAIRYYHPLSVETDKLKELEQKVRDTYNEYFKRDSASYVKTRTSEFIGCNRCKSRLASKYLTGNFCPVCRADLRSETIIKSIAAAKNKWETAKKNREEYINKHSKKEICWLVKIEYHT